MFHTMGYLIYLASGVSIRTRIISTWVELKRLLGERLFGGKIFLFSMNLLCPTLLLDDSSLAIYIFPKFLFLCQTPSKI